MDVPLDQTLTPEELFAQTGQTVRPEGLGGDEALRLWAEVLGPACLSVDHQRYLSFIPNAPTKAACYFDMLVAASNVYGVRGWKVPEQSTPKTRRCAGSRTWPACRPRQAA